MKILLDEMWPPWMAEQLRARGHDAQAVLARVDLIGQPDRVVFAVASTDERAIAAGCRRPGQPGVVAVNRRPRRAGEVGR